MSNNTIQTPAEILISSAVKTVGKREFLKTVENIFGIPQKTSGSRTKKTVSQEHQCEARVKGERTGFKNGRFVLIEQARCDRKEVSTDSHLCAIHSNQVAKFGSLPHGRATEELTEELKNIFV